MAPNSCEPRAIRASSSGAFGFEHVEAKLAVDGRVPLGRHERELRLPVDEALDEPGAGDPIDVDRIIEQSYRETTVRLPMYQRRRWHGHRTSSATPAATVP